jgi:hypothetical protein
VCGDLIAGVENRIKCAAHVADPGDAVGEEEWKHEIRAIGSGTVEVDVSVHIPQAGDEIFAMGVDDLSGLWLITLAWIMVRVCA